MLKSASLFSGIGGSELAAEWAGWNNVFHCEINPFGQQVLKYYWPNSISYHDIKTTDFTIHRGTIDVLTGGFPCQPYSAAGLRKGKEDERHLWPQMLRAIQEIQPRWVVGENVLGITNWSGGLVFEEVQTDLEASGYEVQAYVLPACGVNAPHRRDRVWFVAHNKSEGWGKRNRPEVDIQGRKMAESGQEWSSLRNDTRTGDKAGSGITTNNTNSGIKSVQSGKDGVYEPESTTNPGLLGQEKRQIEPMGIEQLCKQWPSANPNINTEGSPRTSGGIESNRSKNNDEPEKWGSKAELNPGSHELLRDATDTRCSERQNWLHGKEPGRETTEFGDSYTKYGRFSKFPITEPTICRGNDGLSSQLDGITFPKWRNESIKAYGNAIVPQVLFQIFKSINNYEQTN